MTRYIAIAFFAFLIGCKGNSQEHHKKETAKAEKEHFKVEHTDAEWKQILTPIQYYVLRQAGTETQFSSPLLENKKKGVYVCAACGTELFRSENKYRSGTGWPSFDREIKGNVAFDVDYKLGYKRTEEHCAVCGGHLGHMFNDGPQKTTGMRHCINGAALKFVPDDATAHDQK